MSWWDLHDEAEVYVPCQDNAANTNVDVLEEGAAGSDGTLEGGDNTADITTTGPGSGFPSALGLDGANDTVDLPQVGVLRNVPGGSIACWGEMATTGGTDTLAYVSQGSVASGRLSLLRTGSNFAVGGRSANSDSFQQVTSTATYTTGVWRHIAGTMDCAADELLLYVNGSAVTTTGSVSFSQSTTEDGDSADVAVGGATTVKWTGDVAGCFIFDRKISAAEVAELYNGPEPENTVAPVASIQTGDGSPGSVLVTTNGTWDSHDNGTVTFTYQWYADGSPIGGATSSTFDTTGRSSGESITCTVSASNDGGNHAAFDTSSNGITLSGAPEDMGRTLSEVFSFFPYF